MKKFSKIISLFLVLALCLSTFIVSARATTKAKNYTLNLNANKSKGYSWTCTVNNKKSVNFTVKRKRMYQRQLVSIHLPLSVSKEESAYCNTKVWHKEKDN